MAQNRVTLHLASALPPQLRELARRGHGPLDHHEDGGLYESAHLIDERYSGVLPCRRVRSGPDDGD